MSKSNRFWFCCQKSRSPSPSQHKTQPEENEHSRPEKEERLILVKDTVKESETLIKETVTESKTLVKEIVKETPVAEKKSVDNQVSPPAAVTPNNNKAVSEPSPVKTEDVNFVVKSTIPTTEQSSPIGTTVLSIDNISRSEIDDLLIQASHYLAEGGLSREMEEKLSSLIERLEAVTGRLESASQTDSSDGGGQTSVFVTSFDDLLSDAVKTYVHHSNEIGGEVQTQAKMMEKIFHDQREFLVTVSKSKSPSVDVLRTLVEPIAQQIQAIEAYVSENRKSPFFDHLSGVGSSVNALMWITVSPTPGPFVKEMADSSQFYLNRVLKNFKEKDAKHVVWTRSWMTVLKDLQAYIKQYHTTGLTWNPKGGDASGNKASSKPAAAHAAPAAGGPPPPPPPPSNLFDDIGKTSSNTSNTSLSAKGALFADLSKGTDVTKGLKKVTDDMKTHKNPNLKLQTPQPYKPIPSAKPSVNAFAAKKVSSVKPPKCELENKKWVVEYQNGNKNINIADTNNQQTVYIFKCENSTIQVKGKVNSIVLDGCKKTALVFDDVIASTDVINCSSVQIQVTGKVHLMNIDKTDGCMIYLSKDSINAEIVTAKSSEMNILVPKESGEFNEFALPEQFKSVWNGKKFVTTQTDVVG